MGAVTLTPAPSQGRGREVGRERNERPRPPRGTPQRAWLRTPPIHSFPSLDGAIKGKGSGIWLVAALLLTLFLVFPAAAQTFPPLSGRVVDQAKLLSAEQSAALEAKLAALEQQSGRQMAVATVPDLEGHPIEDYGYRLGRQWGLGDKRANDGLILLVAPNDRKVRIEVGYGLEPIVTDALSSLIVQRHILPKFRDKDMPGGIVAGADALIELLRLPDAEAQARAQQLVAQHREEEKGGLPLSLIFWGVVLFFMFGSSILNRFGGGRRYRRGGGPVVLWGPGWGGGGGWGGGSGGGWGGGGFSGGGGSFGGGGSSGSW